MAYFTGVIRAIQAQIRDCNDRNQPITTQIPLEKAMQFLSPLQKQILVCPNTTTYWRDYLLHYTRFDVSMTETGAPNLCISYENGPLHIIMSGSSLQDFQFSQNIDQIDGDTDLTRRILGDLKTIFERALGIQFPSAGCQTLSSR